MNYTKIGETDLYIPETEKAICFRNVWIPKSLVSEISKNRAMIKSWFYAKELAWTVK